MPTDRPRLLATKCFISTNNKHFLVNDGINYCMKNFSRRIIAITVIGTVNLPDSVMLGRVFRLEHNNVSS